jgi:hypothetical protein
LLSQLHEEQVREDADLGEREAWVVSMILAKSVATWDLLAKPTLRFKLDFSGDSGPYHLELGRFTHLAALTDLTEGEHALIASPTPCWARVYPHQARQRASKTGAQACSYVPITVGEAVATLGLGRIICTIEDAIRAAGSELREQAELLSRRQERLVDVERSLGWDEDPQDMSLDRTTAIRTQLAYLLMGRSGRTGRALFATVVGLLLTMFALLFNPQILFVAIPSTAVGFLIWDRLTMA